MVFLRKHWVLFFQVSNKGAAFTAFSLHPPVQKKLASHPQMRIVLWQQPAAPHTQPLSEDGFSFEQRLQTAERTVAFSSALLVLGSCLNT